MLFLDSETLFGWDRLVDAGWPLLGVLAVAGVECVVEGLLGGCEHREGRFNVGEHVVGDGHDEEGVVG